MVLPFVRFLKNFFHDLTNHVQIFDEEVFGLSLRANIIEKGKKSFSSPTKYG